MTLKERITEDMKAAMRASEKERLLTIRMVQAAIKQREVDERIVLDDAQVIAVLEKMIKQRRESIAAFEQGRPRRPCREGKDRDRAAAGLPADAALGDEVDALIKEAIATTGATSMKDMGKVIGAVEGEGRGARRHRRGRAQHQGRSKRLTGFAPGAGPGSHIAVSSLRSLSVHPVAGVGARWDGAVSTREETCSSRRHPKPTSLLALSDNRSDRTTLTGTTPIPAAPSHGACSRTGGRNGGLLPAGVAHRPGSGSVAASRIVVAMVGRGPVPLDAPCERR